MQAKGRRKTLRDGSLVALCPLTSVLCPLTSVLCPLTSVLCPLPSDSLDKTHVLGNAGLRFFRPVAIGHFVAEAGAQAGLADGVGDQIERTCDDIRAGMMVNQGGCAVANGVHQADQRAQRYAVRVQGFVQRPP